jgi:quercetin dioxygenase-like cupin family protein
MRTLVAFVLALAAEAGALQGPGIDRTTVLDNSTVTVTRLRFEPLAKESEHTHPFPILVIQLSRGDLVLSERGVLRLGNRAGEVWFVPANTMHAVSSRSQTPMDVIGVALKPDRVRAAASPASDAPPGITRHTLVDNDNVRVVRAQFAPGSREPLHSHPNDLLTLQITRGTVEIVNGAERSTAAREPGFAQFLPRTVQHAFASGDTQPFEILSIAIK